MISLAWEGDWPITQLFGERPSYYAQFGLAGHNGLDVACPEGTVIRAIADGVLIESRYDPAGYGLYCKLRTPNGTDVLYAHLSKPPDQSVGEIVLQGAPIGQTGNTGYSSGPHLHIGVRPDWRYRGGGYLGYCDPLPWLLSL